MFPALLALALAAPGYAEVRVTDAATGRGVPLVELETTHGVRFVTDNAGRVAVGDPDLLGREVFFSLTTHGYEVPKDGFGVAGVRVTPRVGTPATVALKRLAIAERLDRLTGEGRFRDSQLLGHDTPPPNNGRVAGQDSVQAAIYGGKAFWLWGDTSRLEYPLGLFRTAGATTPLPLPDPADGLRYDYLHRPHDRVRPGHDAAGQNDPRVSIWLVRRVRGAGRRRRREDWSATTPAARVWKCELEHGVCRVRRRGRRSSRVAKQLPLGRDVAAPGRATRPPSRRTAGGGCCSAARARRCGCRPPWKRCWTRRRYEAFTPTAGRLSVARPTGRRPTPGGNRRG